MFAPDLPLPLENVSTLEELSFRLELVETEAPSSFSAGLISI